MLADYSNGVVPSASDKKKYSHKISEWVLSKVDAWKSNRVSNYDQQWELYEKIYRGIGGEVSINNKKLATSFISPATQQAVESSVAELEETVFGRGVPFDIKDDVLDTEKGDVEETKAILWDDMQRREGGVRKAISEALINGAVYGTGVAEIQVESISRKVPIQVQTPVGGVPSVETKKEVIVKWRAINPYNFLIDPDATCISDALGCAVQEFQGKHIVQDAMNKGYYKETPITSSAASDSTIEKDKTITVSDTSNRVKILKYYGLVPRAYIEEYNKPDVTTNITEILPKRKKERVSEEDAEAMLSELETTAASIDEETDMVEALVVIMNDQDCLKAEVTPYTMEDRPIIAFPWEIVPGRFWGRGVVEKGFYPQMCLDEEIRNRLQVMELVTEPMVGIDATKLPRGFKFSVERGRNLFVNGRPSEIMEPFKIGELDPNTWRNSETLERMVFQATGAADLSGIPSDINGEATAAGMSMALSGVIKRTKRVIINFYDQFLMPGVQKTAWRYMQFAPEKYRSKDFNFIPASTMGIMAREYEQGQLVSLLNTMKPDSPQYSAILMGIVENSSLHGREAIIKMIAQSQQPNPKQQEAENLAKASAVADLKLKETEAARNQASAFKTLVETKLMPDELRARFVGNLVRNQDESDTFDKKVEIAKLALQEKDIVSNERIATLQMTNAENNKKLDAMMELVRMANDKKEQEFLYDDEGNVKGSRFK